MFRLFSRAAPSLAAAVVAPISYRSYSSCRTEESPRSDLHGLDPSLQKRSQTSAARPVGSSAKRYPTETHVVRIALTGGPCAGKSSALEHIVASAKKEGFDVYTPPETATILFNSGVPLPTTPDGWYKFQQSLTRLQLQFERSMTRIAGITGRPSIIIFDRGILDAMAYMDEEGWKRLLSDVGCGGDGHPNGIDEEYILKRYDAVVHLVTAADGAEQFYKWGETTDDSGNTVIRSEPPQIARELDQKLQQAWKGHKKHVIIKNTSDGFTAKLQTTSDVVVSIAKAKHPTPLQR